MRFCRVAMGETHMAGQHNTKTARAMAPSSSKIFARLVQRAFFRFLSAGCHQASASRATGHTAPGKRPATWSARPARQRPPAITRSMVLPFPETGIAAGPGRRQQKEAGQQGIHVQQARETGEEWVKAPAAGRPPGPGRRPTRRGQQPESQRHTGGDGQHHEQTPRRPARPAGKCRL